MEIHSLIATPESDARLRKEWMNKGIEARIAGLKKEECPVNGMIKGWWEEGWDACAGWHSVHVNEYKNK